MNFWCCGPEGLGGDREGAGDAQLQRSIGACPDSAGRADTYLITGRTGFKISLSSSERYARAKVMHF